MIFFYRLFYFILKNLLRLGRPFLSPDLKNWLALRERPLEKAKAFKSAYWFHAASGEIEYCKSVIRLLKIREPKAQIVVTYTSPSAEKLFQNIASFVDQFIPLGWDQPEHVKELINYIQPKALIFARTDFWPELITQAKKRKIPLGVVSFNSKLGFMNRTLLNQFDFVSALNAGAENVLHGPAVSVDGDPRFDQVFFRLAQPPKLQITANGTLFICGSTWPEDEEILFQIFPSLLQKNIKIALSPHEVSAANIDRLKKKLVEKGFSFQVLSEGPSQVALTSDILIIDQIGFLADCYRFAGFAFVGGSFREKIHSVMEPLCCGLPVLTGPFYKNNPEAVKYTGRYVFPFDTADGFNQLLPRLLGLNRDEILTEMKKNQNATVLVADLIAGTILKSANS